MSIDYKDETKEQSLERIFTEITSNANCGYQEVTYLNSRPGHRDFDYARTLDSAAFLEFIRASQPKQYEKMKYRAQDLADKKILDAFDEAVRANGLLHVLRKGFSVLGTSFHAFYPYPENTLDAEAMLYFEMNKFYCARQFHYSKEKPNNSIDMVLLINGIPVVAIELKNNFTGQSADDAVSQFCTDRSQDDPMFKLNRRCLVLFAVDNYDVQMTTYLNGLDTNFIPFNQGSNGPGNKGHKGNPVIEGQVPTHYLFDEVLTKSNLSRIITDFMTFEEGDKPKVIFPRYHQFDCVNHFVNEALDAGPGHSYLIQHSAGSGKSNTIAWLAYRLLAMQKNGESVFDSVIICVHRTVLNDQLNHTVSLFEYTPGMVAYVDSSAELKDALLNGNKIVVSTIQKFGMINEALKPYKRNFAIIFDEAHTTTTGRLNIKTKMALGHREITPEEYLVLGTDYNTEEQILKAYEKIRHEGNQDNMNFYAFTATPTEKTLHAFGKKLTEANYDAHHHYCMMQAIEEGFICDVLEDYHTYMGYFDMMRKFSESDDPMVDKQKVNKILREMERNNDLVLEQKAKVIVNYFRENVEKDLNGRAKAMLVVDGRITVLQYRKAIMNVCRALGYDGIKPMVAFSGSLDWDGDTVTEKDFNIYKGRNVKSKDMAEVFSTPEFNLMIAADKFQVGFDQPYLTTMFVDKFLQKVETVQTLSRLNRVIPGVNKHTHVLDFRNTSQDVLNDFSLYYEGTQTEEGYDPTYIYTIRTNVESMGVIQKENVIKFASEFKSTDPDALKKLSGLLEPARAVYMMMSAEDQNRFRKSANTLKNQYRTVTVANNMMDPYFSDLVQYIHYLLLCLPKRPSDPLPDIQKMVSLDHYRLVSNWSGSLSPVSGDPLQNPHPSLPKDAPAPDLLSEIVRKFNLRWGLTDFNDSDKVAMLRSVVKDMVQDISATSDISEYRDWSAESFNKQFRDKTKTKLINRAVKNKDFLNSMLNDTASLNEMVDQLLDMIHYSQPESME